MRNLHAELMVVCGWTPEQAWSCSIVDALWCVRKARQLAAEQAQLTALLVTAPFGGKSALANAREVAESLLAPIGREPSLAERHGSTVADEVEQLEERQRAWLAERTE